MKWPGAVVELPHASEGLVPVAADAERPQDVEVGLRLDREPEEPHPDAIERACRLHRVTQLPEGPPLGHRERHQPGAVGPARVRVGAGEGAPDDPAGVRVHESRAPDAGYHDHRVAGGVSGLGGAVVEAPEIGRRRTPAAQPATTSRATSAAITAWRLGNMMPPRLAAGQAGSAP